jgi:hypothetical protein
LREEPEGDGAFEGETGAVAGFADAVRCLASEKVISIAPRDA